MIVLKIKYADFDAGDICVFAKIRTIQRFAEVPE
jgi:hypothetical protein